MFVYDLKILVSLCYRLRVRRYTYIRGNFRVASDFRIKQNVLIKWTEYSITN